MNQTNINHAIIALVMQAVVGAITGNWLAGALFAIGWFVSREHAQRECQLSLRTGRTVQSLKVWEGFTGWDQDRYLDSGLPVVATSIVWLVSLA